MPALSIVLPVYNVDLYLNACLDSIAAQTFRDFECILVDDGSTDFSGIICDSYARKDPRFKVIHQENAGVSAARNVGIELSTAPLLTFVDPDDFLSKDYFEELVTNLMHVNADVSTSLFCVVEEDGNEGKFWISNYLDRIMRRSSAHELLNNHDVTNAVYENFFSCVSWGKVFKRELWGNARFPAGIDLGEDMMTVPAVIIKARAAVFAQKATYYYRQREKSLLHGTVSKDRYLKDLQASRKMMEQLEQHAPEHKRDFALLKLHYDLGCYVSYLKSSPKKQTGGSKLYRLVGGSEGINALQTVFSEFINGGTGNERTAYTRRK